MSESEGKEVKRGVGRPTIKNDEIINALLIRLATTNDSLRSICKEPNMPDLKTIWNWTQKDEEFFQQYRRAMSWRAERMAEDTIEISDEIVENSHEAQRQRNRLDTRKWVACKLAPKLYGDKVEVSGPEGKPLPILQLTFAIPGQAIETIEPEPIEYKPDK